MFSSIRIAIILFCISALGAGYWYVQKLQSDLETSRANVAKLEIVAATNQATIAKMESNMAMLEENNQQLSKNLQEASAYKDELIAKLQKHDLSRLSLKKPGLIESRINNGTKEVFDALECLSGNCNP